MTIGYRLDANGEPEAMPDFREWAQWMETAERTVAKTQIGEMLVSTVFLGLNHGSGGDEPILWETMVFRGEDHSGEQMDRCGGSREQALAMHARMVERVEKSLAHGSV